MNSMTGLAGICLFASVASCGVVGLDGYGRPVSCTGNGVHVAQLQGDWRCVNGLPTLSGDLPPTDARVEAQLREAAAILGQTVAYTDGRTTVTFFPV